MGEKVIRGGPAARRHNKRNALVAVKPGYGGQRAALHLNHRDPEAGGVEDELLKRHSSLRDNQQSD